MTRRFRDPKRLADYELTRTNHAKIMEMRLPTVSFGTYQDAYRHPLRARRFSRTDPRYPFWAAGVDNRRKHDEARNKR